MDDVMVEIAARKARLNAMSDVELIRELVRGVVEEVIHYLDDDGLVDEGTAGRRVAFAEEWAAETLTDEWEIQDPGFPEYVVLARLARKPATEGVDAGAESVQMGDNAST